MGALYNEPTARFEFQFQVFDVNHADLKLNLLDNSTILQPLIMKLPNNNISDKFRY